MIRIVLAMLILTSTSAAGAQEPIIRTELGADATVPGQPVELRLTVLAPTWFPKPPDLPTYDMPNLMVRLPPKSTFPVSEPIDGETWSGIYRVYRLYPLVPGIFDLPAQTVRVHYAQPGSPDPVTVELRTDPLTLAGTVPENAIDLDPFIAARGLDLEQTVEGEITDVELGEAITRRLRISVDGAPPMVVPTLLDPQRAPGLAEYAREPVLEEITENGRLSGSRTEQVTYVAEAGGRFVLPSVRIDWYNLETGEVESLEADGFEITVRGPPPTTTEPGTPPQVLLAQVLTVLLVAALGVGIWFRLGPRLKAWRDQRRARYLASEHYAFKRALRAIQKQRLGPALTATGDWWRLHRHGASVLPAKLAAAFLPVGQSLYGRGAGDRSQLGSRWTHAGSVLRDTARRENRGAAIRASRDLPPLNPQAPRAGRSNDP